VADLVSAVLSEYSAAPACRMESKETRYDRRMTADSLPFRLLLATLAGWVNRDQQHVIDYLAEENRVLREQLRGRPVQLTDDQRRRLVA